MPGKNSHPATAVAERPSRRTAKPIFGTKTKAAEAPVFKPRVPAASLVKAKKAFKKFNLSKFADVKMPSNYVIAGDSPADTQKRIISKQIERMTSERAAASALPSASSMTIALPPATIKKLLPSPFRR